MELARRKGHLHTKVQWHTMKAEAVFSKWEDSVTVPSSSKNRAFVEMLLRTPRPHP